MSTWSPPPDHNWSVGVLENAANLNIFHRDNLNATLHQWIYKPRDDSQTSNATPRDDQHLWFYVGASEVWYIQFYLLWYNAASTTPDILVGFNVPSGTLFNTEFFTHSGSGRDYITNDSGGGQTTIGASGSEPSFQHMTTIRGTFRTSTAVGRVQVKWSQNTSSANATVVRKGSSILATRISP